MPDPEASRMSLSAPLPLADQEAQKEIDRIADQAVAYSADIFQKIFAPVLNILDKETDLKALKDRLSDKEELKKLYEDMDNRELEDLLAQASYLAALIGRSGS